MYRHRQRLSCVPVTFQGQSNNRYIIKRQIILQQSKNKSGQMLSNQNLFKHSTPTHSLSKSVDFKTFTKRHHVPVIIIFNYNRDLQFLTGGIKTLRQRKQHNV